MGRVMMSGIVPTLKAPVTGVLASSLAVGSTVKLMEGSTAVEYLVVNQGIPSNSSLYDASCDGTWLLRKYIHSERQWNTSNVNKYESSAINTWLNGEFFNALGSAEQAAIKQVKSRIAGVVAMAVRIRAVRTVCPARCFCWVAMNLAGLPATAATSRLTVRSWTILKVEPERLPIKSESAT